MARTEPTVNLKWCETHVVMKAILSNGTTLRLGSAKLEAISESAGSFDYEAKITKDSQVKISTTRSADQVTLNVENVDKELGLTLNDINSTLLGAKVTCSKVFSDIAQNIKATGQITFTGTPSNGNTITIGGITFTFRTGTATGTKDILINGTSGTATNTAAKLNASTIPPIYMAAYSAAAGVVNIEYNLGGSEGNAFTLAKSGTNISLSGSTLTGGDNATKTWERKVLLTGEIANVDANQNEVTIKIVSDTAPNVAFISARPVQDSCPLIFKGEACGYTGILTTCNKLYESDGGCSGRNKQSRYGGIVVKGELPKVITGDIDTEVEVNNRLSIGPHYPNLVNGRIRLAF